MPLKVQMAKKKPSASFPGRGLHRPNSYSEMPETSLSQHIIIIGISTIETTVCQEPRYAKIALLPSFIPVNQRRSPPNK